MTTALQKSIVQRVREFLQVGDECSSTELYTQLREYRNQLHPDRYVEEEAKKAAEERFKVAQELLPELFRYIQDEAVRKTPAELVLYKPIYNQVFTQQELDAAKNLVAELTQEKASLESRIEDLQSQRRTDEDTRIRQERQKLEKLYRPTKRSLASLGVVLALSALMPAMSKVKEVSEFIGQYSPLSPETIKTTVFAVLVVMLVLTLKRYLENILFRRRILEVCSTPFTVRFMEHLRSACTWEAGKPKKFRESQAYEFTSAESNTWRVFGARVPVALFHVGTRDLLKNCFIDYLIQRQLVAISDAECLDRSFIIKDTKIWWL